MPREITIILIVLFLAGLLVWFCLGPEVARYIGGPLYWPFWPFSFK